MDIRIRKHPVEVKGDTRDCVESKIHRRFAVTSHTISLYGNGMMSNNLRSDEFVMVNYQKFRSKRGVRKAHWIAYVYTFDVNFLQAAGLKVVQRTRHFDIVSNK